MEPKLKKELKKILLGIGIFFLFMICEKLHLLPMIFEHRLAAFAAYLIPYGITGYPVVRKALLGIRNRQPFDESFLMFIATIGAFATGENSEAVAVMAFYQVGEWFQAYAVGKSRKNIAALMDIVPETANVESPDGTVETMDPDEVSIGDILVVKPGERIPVDGEVLSGESMINTAALTGESVPRAVYPGASVISGCINGEGLLRIRAEKAFEDSTVSKILELVENATEKKSKTENFITRFARVYTPIVVYGALALAVIPSVISGDPATWIYRACTFLVISCPCALVISVPLAFFGGIGAAGSNGVLVKGSNYLEQIAKLRILVSDKTGTLSEGNFKVYKVCPKEAACAPELLQLAAAAEGSSTHPIAKSIREELKKQAPRLLEALAPVTESENIAGQGLKAVVEGDYILVGNKKLMESQGIAVKEIEDPASTVVYVGRIPDKNGRPEFLGTILIRDIIKKEAREAIEAMRNAGVEEVIMLTGDRTSVGEAVGRELQVDRVYADLLPQDKVGCVEKLLQERNTEEQVLGFVGDGINDAPVLARADVGIAMGSMGSDAAIEAADVVIMDDDLRRIPMVIRIAHKTVRIATQNIVFALVIKALILLFGAMGIANMWAAVFADVGVAVLCILNSMRILRTRRTI